jgi:NADH dehydrogenase [ubiquinone] 1 alpha subcomplex assembly factor 6
MPNGMTVAPAYISDLVKKDDHDRFLTAVLAPPDVRDGVMALYAFNAEVAKVRESVTETMIGRMKLQWWRDVIAAVYDGGKVPQGNPVVDALAGTIKTYNLTRAHFERLLDARERDMSDDSPQDVAMLENYAEGTSVALTWLALEVLGARDDASMSAGRHVGMAWALTGMLRAVLFHARVNRFLLPQDLMAAEDLSGHDLQERRNAAKIAVVVEQIAATARAHIDAARSLRTSVDAKALPALLPATLADAYLKGLAQRRFDVFDPRHVLQRPAAFRLMLNAWRGRY